MFLGRVIGRVVATMRVTGLTGVRLQIVQPVDENGETAGDTVVACDVVDSGPGDLVHVCDGREATLALPAPFVPVDATIVGHVEQFAHTGSAPMDPAGQADRADRADPGPPTTPKPASRP